jgi:hypothetical protein
MVMLFALMPQKADAQMLTCGPKKGYVLADCTKESCSDSLTLWRVTDLKNCNSTLKMGDTPEDLQGYFEKRIMLEDVVDTLSDEERLVTLSFSERCIGRDVDNNLVYTCQISALDVGVVPQLTGDSVREIRDELFTIKTMSSKTSTFKEKAVDVVKYSSTRLFFLSLIIFSFSAMIFSIHTMSFVPALCASFGSFCFQLILLVMIKPEVVENEGDIDFTSAQGVGYDLNVDNGHPVLMGLIVVGWLLMGLYTYKVKGKELKEKIRLLQLMK